MPEVDVKIIQSYRARRYRSQPGFRLHTPQEAVAFVNDLGFVFFWPIKGIEMPSLWAAAAGDRPVPDEHDDPGHITWGWKDDLLGKSVWYYGRLLRRRNTIVSLECLPYFYALSPNYGDPENDYLEQYQRGEMTLEARLVYEALMKKGPLDTLSLRREAHLEGPASTGRFNRALDDLQIELKVLPVGVSQAGAWHYAFVYDLVYRHFPDLEEKARPISERQAREHLAYTYLKNVGGSRAGAISRVFSWPVKTGLDILKSLQTQGNLVMDVQVGSEADWALLPDLA